jgi:hypothetical protein
MVPTTGLEPVKQPFTGLLAKSANGISLPFIAQRVANTIQCLQAICGNQWNL